MRGCCLKNTKYIIGFVAYTGHETKIMMNAFKSKSKMSTVEKLMGKQILIIFFVQVCIFFFFFFLQFRLFYVCCVQSYIPPFMNQKKTICLISASHLIRFKIIHFFTIYSFDMAIGRFCLRK